VPEERRGRMGTCRAVRAVKLFELLARVSGERLAAAE
jgi:hypothetical protein